MKLIRILGIAAAVMAAAVQSNAQATNSPLLVATPISAPTITWSDITPSGSSTKTLHYVATFTANYQASNGDLTLGFPNATLPLVALVGGNSGSVSIYKNGVPDPLYNYSVSVFYSLPSKTSVADSTFTLSNNSSVSFAITVTFDIVNPGNDTYGVKLNRLFWTSSNGKDVTELGEGWATAYTSPTGGTDQVPDQIKALYSKAALGSYLAATAKYLYAQIWSTAQVGTVQPQRVVLQNGASEADINAALATIRLPIELTSVNADVYYSVYVTNGDDIATLSGSANQRPETGKASYVLPEFTITLGFNGNPVIPWPGVTQAQLQIRDEKGSITSTQSLDVTTSGFYFPPSAAGNSILVVTDAKGSHVYDLQNHFAISTEKVEGSAAVSKADTESVIDSDTLNLIPFTQNGYGDNVLGEIKLTQDRIVSVAGMTSEGVKMIGLHVRKMDGTWVPVEQWSGANALNGVVNLRLTAGEWQVIADWPDGTVIEPPYQNSGKGG